MTATILPLGGDGAAERAYDALAGGYEAAIAEDAWMRRVLHRHHARRFAPGSRVLDAACGTGLDSLALARRGVEVTAVDVSAGMLALLERRLAVAAGPAIDVRRADLAELAGWPAGRFDGIVSSFAGINATDPAAFAAAARRLLVPGGRMVLHLLTPAGAGGGSRGDDERTVVVLAGTPVRHWALPARQAYRRVFASGFRLRRAYALGFLLPRRCGRWLPSAVVDGVGRLEERLGSRLPFLERGRFVVLDLERRPG